MRSRPGRRTDRAVGATLERQLQRDAEREQWGSAYADHGLVFAREDGEPLRPDRVTKRFRQLATAAGLRPVRLQDLRHGAASLMLAAGVPMAIVSKMLRHSSIGITVDTYGHLSDDTARAALTTPSRGSGDDDAASPVEGVTAGQKAVSLGTPPGTRTPNPLIKRHFQRLSASQFR